MYVEGYVCGYTCMCEYETHGALALQRRGQPGCNSLGDLYLVFHTWTPSRLEFTIML